MRELHHGLKYLHGARGLLAGDGLVHNNWEECFWKSTVSLLRETEPAICRPDKQKKYLIKEEI